MKSPCDISFLNLFSSIHLWKVGCNILYPAVNPVANLCIHMIPFVLRSLRSLKLCDNHLDWNFSRMVFSTLLDASSSISNLDLSENNVE